MLQDSRTSARSHARAVSGHCTWSMRRKTRSKRSSVMPVVSMDGILASYTCSGSINVNTLLHFIRVTLVSALSLCFRGRRAPASRPRATCVCVWGEGLDVGARVMCECIVEAGGNWGKGGGVWVGAAFWWCFSLPPPHSLLSLSLSLTYATTIFLCLCRYHPAAVSKTAICRHLGQLLHPPQRRGHSRY